MDIFKDRSIVEQSQVTITAKGEDPEEGVSLMVHCANSGVEIILTQNELEKALTSLKRPWFIVDRG